MCRAGAAVVDLDEVVVPGYLHNGTVSEGAGVAATTTYCFFPFN